MGRYDGVDYSLIIDKEGVAKKFLHLATSRSADEIEDFGVYEIENEEELDLVSKKLYGDSNLWYILAEVNEIDFIFDIEAGDKIIFPQSTFLE